MLYAHIYSDQEHHFIILELTVIINIDIFLDVFEDSDYNIPTNMFRKYTVFNSDRCWCYCAAFHS